MGFLTFVKGALSDEGGEPSFSRLGSGVAVLCACAWVTMLVHHNHALPDFSGLALFIGTLYGLNTLRNMKG